VVQFPVLPVINGMLPRAEGGMVHGVVLDAYSAAVFARNGVGKYLFVCPWDQRAKQPFHVGIIAVCRDTQIERHTYEQKREYRILRVLLEGQERAKMRSFIKKKGIIYGDNIELQYFKTMRPDYPVLCGAGWQASGGYTETASLQDISVVIYGTNYETGAQVHINGNLGGLISYEQAHTIEHAIIRSLKHYSLCTARTLVQCSAEETNELKQSVEWGIKYARPDLLGLTQSGACGNPLSSTAQIYMAQEFTSALKEGNSIYASVEQARIKTMSRLTGDLGITTREGLRILQGLKRGMFHDDTPLTLEQAKKILNRFPISPWK